MDQTAGGNKSKGLFSGLLSRLGTKGSARGSSAGPSVASTDLHDEDQTGPLGLTTLYDPLPPLNPVADIVFIHGLGGGSRKTWSFSCDPAHYWPQAWLPADDDFKNVRIHSFGYNSDWGERRQSVLDVRGIAQSLVVALRNDPAICRTNTSRIILVGHSMGGFVAKSVYTVARNDPAAKDFAARVHSIFFLATPHRGSSLASTLGNILAAVGWGKKSYLADLTRNSTALAIINDEFRHIAPDLRLWSFRETLSTQRAGFLNQLVVELDSAALGFPHEEIVDMNADHRHVCKFESLVDPNYKLLRNALHKAVSMIRELMTTSTSTTASPVALPVASPPATFPASSPRATPATFATLPTSSAPATPASLPTASPAPPQSGDSGPGTSKTPTEPAMSPALARSILSSFLEVDDSAFEPDLKDRQKDKEPGSCKWFTEQESFESWRAGKTPGILWLVGKPGAGKSTLSGHVIEHLTTTPDYCSYFIFKHSTTTWSTCFRALAFQMAIQDSFVRDALLQLHREGSFWDRTDETRVWHRLFASCIFKLPSLARHFWVVDGVDECKGFSKLFIAKLLVDLPKDLKFFATSRDMAQIKHGLRVLGPGRTSTQELSDANTAPDIRLFVRTQLAYLDRQTQGEQESMCEEILGMSSGSFLWASLVIKRLGSAWSNKAMKNALAGIPTGLSKFYLDMAKSIDGDEGTPTLATSILTWVVLAPRPLTVDELSCAVRLDTDEKLQDTARAVPNLCAQMVFVDSNDRVQVIHETVREFWLKARPDSGFHVDEGRGHGRLACLLLRYLCNEAFDLGQAGIRPDARDPRGLFKRTPVIETSPPPSILEYACAFFSEHLSKATPSDHNLLAALSTFFEGTVLFWIEHIAQRRNLTPIIQAANNIREYLDKSAQHKPRTDQAPDPIHRWPTELIRVAAKFRPQLLTCPSSIHHLIPPLCPSESLIAQRFGHGRQSSPASSRLIVQGLLPGAWESDDCLIRMDFPRDIPTAVCHGIRVFAIGMLRGTISIYDAVSLQVLRKIHHPAIRMVHRLQFGPSDALLAACDEEHLVIWNPVTGTALHLFSMGSQPYEIAFRGVDAIMAVSEFFELTTWNLETEQHETMPWITSESCDGHPQNRPGFYMSRTGPIVPAAFLVTQDGVLLAFASGNGSISILNALNMRILGRCQVGSASASPNILAVAFNPNPKLPALVATFDDSGLCVFNYVTGELQYTDTVDAMDVSWSPDGQLLVISRRWLDGMEVFGFELGQNGNMSLHTIYRSTTDGSSLVSGTKVVFSADGRRLVHICSHQGRVWAPTALAGSSGVDLPVGSTSPSTTNDTPLWPARNVKPWMVRPSRWPDIFGTLVPSTDQRFLVAETTDQHVVVISANNPSDVRFLCLSDVPTLPQETREDRFYGRIWNHIVVGPQRFTIWTASFRRLLAYAVDLETTESKDLADLPTKAPTLVTDRWFDETIGYVLTSPSGDRVLVRGDGCWDRLCTIPSGSIYFRGGKVEQVKAPPQTALTPEPTTGDAVPLLPQDAKSAFQHPSNPDWFVIVDSVIARIYAWTDFTELTRPEGIRLARSPRGSLLPWTRGASYHVGPDFVIENLPTTGGGEDLYLWPTSQLDPTSPTSIAFPATTPNLTAIAPSIRAILHIIAPSTIVFLDVKLWVCTLEVQSLPPNPKWTMVADRQIPFRTTPASTNNETPSSANIESTPFQPTRSPVPTTAEHVPTPHVRRHFFLLNEWQGTYGTLRCTVILPPPGPDGSGEPDWRDAALAVVNRDRAVIIRGGFRFGQDVVVSTMEMPSLWSAGESEWKVVEGDMRQARW